MITTAATHREGELVHMVPRQVVVTTAAMGRHRQAAVVAVAATIRQTIRKAAMATIHHRVVTSWHALNRLQPTMAHRPMVVNMARHILVTAMVHHHMATDLQCTVTECHRPTQATAHHHLVMGHRLAAATTHDMNFHPGGKGVNDDQA